MGMASVSSIAAYRQNLGGSIMAPTAQSSRPGENNSMHLATAIGLIALVAIAAGLINVKVAAGR